MKLNRSKKKLQVREKIEDLGDTLPHTNLQDLVNWLYAKQTEFISRGYTGLELRFESGGWDNPHELGFYGTREETDKEYEKRMKEVDKEKRSETAKMQEHYKFIEKEAKRLGLVQ